MGIDVRSSGPRLPTVVTDRQAMAEIGAAALQALISRTFVRGRDTEDKPFRPYSKAYAEVRRESGRQVAPVNLVWSGALQRAVRVKSVTHNDVRIGITGAPAEYGLRLEGKRPWFDLSPGDEIAMGPAVDAALDGAAKRGGR